jgi:hypothetical protein
LVGDYPNTTIGQLGLIVNPNLRWGALHRISFCKKFQQLFVFSGIAPVIITQVSAEYLMKNHQKMAETCAVVLAAISENGPGRALIAKSRDTRLHYSVWSKDVC